jgi:hypothetical protein
MEASGALRQHRRLVPAVPLEVPTPQGTLIFEPIDDHRTPLEARFTYMRGRKRFEGALRLKRPADPLALRIASFTSEAVTGEAWAAALIVYAALTCSDGRDEVPATQPERTGSFPQRGPLRPSQASSGPKRRIPTRHPTGVRRGPVRATFLRDAVAYLEAVSGHLRRLQAGHTASPEARSAAARAGIQLPPGYTWVRPHSRGGQQRVVVAWPRNERLW